MPSPTSIRVLNDLETLRIMADPLRLRLFELLRERPRTVSELAELLDMPRTRLYYHIGLLEEHDLIAVRETRVVSGITEKRYGVTAHRLSVDKTMLGVSDGEAASLEMYLSVMFDEVATEIRRAADAGLIDLEETHHDAFKPRRLVIGRQWYRFTDQQLAEFAKRYTALQADIAEYAVDEPGDPATLQDATIYEWLVSFCPVVPPSEDERD